MRGQHTDMRKTLGIALLSLTTAACAVGPDYERPPVVAPQKWRDPAAATEGPSLANVAWWDLFKDEQLKKLIRIALAENRDLKIAVERIEEMRANVGIAKADFYPALGASVTGGGLNPSNGSLTHTPGEGRDPTGLAVATLDLSWEIDFFGRISRATEAQRALLLASEEARRAVAMALVSDVALTYIDLRGLDRRLAIAQRTLTSRRDNVEYAKTRFEGAVTHEVDMRQAEAELHRLEALSFNIEKQVAQKENELSFLLGHNPEAIQRTATPDEQPVPAQVPAGLPAQLLERRPDVRRAEMELWSATAGIGEAKAMLYPQISLTASYGLASTDLGSFIDPASQTWRLFANLLQPIFNAGKNKARVEARESKQRQAVFAYEKTLLQALREVEDSLVGLSKAGQERGAQKERVTADRRVLELSELRYKGGVAQYLEVLDSQRSLFDAENDEAGSVTEHAKSFVRLYKALGGGWPMKSDKANQPVLTYAPASSSAAPTSTPAPATSNAAPAPAPAPAAPASAPSAPTPSAPAPSPPRP
jgi:multidrug efflux system outer membrane protein